MWGLMYLAIGAVAMLMTWSYAVREEAIVFASAMASVSWALLALTAEVTVIDGGGEVLVAIGPERWLFTAFALLSMIALVGSILGIYPESHPDTQHSQVDNL